MVGREEHTLVPHNFAIPAHNLVVFSWSARRRGHLVARLWIIYRDVRKGFPEKASTSPASGHFVNHFPESEGTALIPKPKFRRTTSLGGRSEERRVGKECRSRWS